MRKILAVVAALMLSAAAIAPAQAATVGQKCTTKLAIAKSGTTKLYCGKNTNKKTVKARPLVWIKSVDCFDLITAYAKVRRDYDSAIKQINDIKTQVAAVQGDTSNLQATLASFEATVKVFEPTVMSMKSQVTALCS